MVFRWLLFGLLLATAIRATVPMDTYQTLFGPTAIGLLLTLVAATIIEVCSEGSTPIAADILTRAAAPGNSFHLSDGRRRHRLHRGYGNQRHQPLMENRTVFAIDNAAADTGNWVFFESRMIFVFCSGWRSLTAF